MVRKALKVNSALELNGAAVCMQTGTTTELNLADYFRANKMNYKPVVFETADETIKAYDAGRCDVYTTDASGLYAERLKLDQRRRPRRPAGDHLQGAARPGGAPGRRPVVRHRQVDALRAAQRRGARHHPGQCRRDAEVEQPGRSSACSASKATSASSSASTNDWAVHIIKQVGNYGEIFERNVGAGLAAKIARGLNALWTKGGLQYAPPIR